MPEILIKLNQPQNNFNEWQNHNKDGRIAWHKKKIDDAKAKIEYHEAELERLTCQ